MSRQLSSDEVDELLQDIDVAWTAVGGIMLERVFKFDDYEDAVAFVNQVAEIAEEYNHHPAILLEHGAVTVTTTTHDVGDGLSERDFDLAGGIDEIAADI